jgi:glyoxylase-like metal-dependent hydrolase (beta-lactamase superfamily II)
MSRPITLTVAVVVPALLALAACSNSAPPPAAEVAAPPEATSAAAAPAAEQNVFRFTIGSLQAFALRDGGLTFPNDNKIVAINKTPEDVAKVLTDAGASPTEISLSVQPLLVQAGDRVLLFDTGAGKNMGPSAGNLAADLADGGIDAGSVTDIFISHAHGDHIGGLVRADGSLAFPNATVHLSAPEWTSLQGTKEQAAVVAAITPKVDAFKPGSELVPGVVKAVEVKGHTPGHSAYLIGSGTDTLLYSGDTMHHSIVSVQQPDWTIAFDGDAPVAQASRKEVLAGAAASGQRIYAVHFPFPGLGKIEKRGEGFVWVPEQ